MDEMKCSDIRSPESNWDAHKTASTAKRVGRMTIGSSIVDTRTEETLILRGYYYL